MGMRKTMVDLYAGQTITAAQELMMEPYQLMVLARVGYKEVRVKTPGGD